MATKIPSFTTTCTFETKLENGYWYIYLKSNGIFAFHYSKSQVDIFVCGGGGGGGISGGEWSYGGGGGAGGYQTTKYGMAIGTESYDIEIGAGGAVESTGGTTTAFGLTASGGSGGSGQTPGKAGTAAGGTGGGYWGDGQGGGGRVCRI